MTGWLEWWLALVSWLARRAVGSERTSDLSGDRTLLLGYWRGMMIGWLEWWLAVVSWLESMAVG